MIDNEDWDFARPWYHGSPLVLEVLRAGSAITQDADVARVFSHRPALVAQPGTAAMKHDGTEPGFLYVVAEAVGPGDVEPHLHPINAARWEWTTRRELRVALVARTTVQEEERLTPEESAELRRRQRAAGATGSVALGDEFE